MGGTEENASITDSAYFDTTENKWVMIENYQTLDDSAVLADGALTTRKGNEVELVSEDQPEVSEEEDDVKDEEKKEDNPADGFQMIQESQEDILRAIQAANDSVSEQNIGDGCGDAPALKKADIGVAFTKNCKVSVFAILFNKFSSYESSLEAIHQLNQQNYNLIVEQQQTIGDLLTKLNVIEKKLEILEQEKEKQENVILGFTEKVTSSLNLNSLEAKNLINSVSDSLGKVDLNKIQNSVKNNVGSVMDKLGWKNQDKKN